MADEIEPFEVQELRTIGERALALARRVDDPSLRIAFSLFGESALNLAHKLPQPEAPPEP